MSMHAERVRPFTMEHQQEVTGSRSIRIGSNDLESWGMRGQIFWQISIITLERCDLECPNLVW